MGAGRGCCRSWWRCCALGSPTLGWWWRCRGCLLLGSWGCWRFWRCGWWRISPCLTECIVRGAWYDLGECWGRGLFLTLIRGPWACKGWFCFSCRLGDLWRGRSARCKECSPSLRKMIPGVSKRPQRYGKSSKFLGWTSSMSFRPGGNERRWQCSPCRWRKRQEWRSYSTSSATMFFSASFESPARIADRCWFLQKSGRGCRKFEPTANKTAAWPAAEDSGNKCADPSPNGRQQNPILLRQKLGPRVCESESVRVRIPFCCRA